MSDHMLKMLIEATVASLDKSDHILFDVFDSMQELRFKGPSVDVKRDQWLWSLVKKSRDKINSLKNAHIVDVLGSGSYGVALSLSNDNVLKIYTQYRGDESKMYAKLQKGLFSGKATAHSTMIYDHGQIDRGIYFVEMSLVEDLESYIKDEYGEVDTDMLGSCLIKLRGKLYDQKSVKDFNLLDKKSVLAFIARAISECPVNLSRDDAQQLSRAIFTAYQQINGSVKDPKKIKIVDIHAGNIGIDPTSGKWIVFDP